MRRREGFRFVSLVAAGAMLLSARPVTAQGRVQESDADADDGATGVDAQVDVEAPAAAPVPAPLAAPAESTAGASEAGTGAPGAPGAFGLPDGHFSVMGAEVKVDAGPYGLGFGGYARMSSQNAMTVSNAVAGGNPNNVRPDVNVITVAAQMWW